MALKSKSTANSLRAQWSQKNQQPVKNLGA